MSIPHIPGATPPEEFRRHIDEFLLDLYQAEYSPQTLRAYGWHLYKMAIFLNTDAPTRVTRNNLRAWGAHLRSVYQPETRKQAVAAAKKFFRFLELEGLITSEENPSSVLQFPKVGLSPQRTLNKDEIQKLLDATSGRTDKEIRDRAIVLLLVDSGVRAGELCNLDIADVSLFHLYAHVVGKGGDREKIYFSAETRTALSAWLSRRPDSLSPALFISLGGLTPRQRLTRRGLRIILQKLGQKAGVTGVHPHAFRRSFAVLRTQNGQPTRSLQVLGRWRNLSMVERYTAVMSQDDSVAREAAEQYSPLKTIKR